MLTFEASLSYVSLRHSLETEKETLSKWDKAPCRSEKNRPMTSVLAAWLEQPQAKILES